MTNLAPLLAKIQEALDREGELCRTWVTGALIVCKTDEKGAEIAYVKADVFHDMFSPEDQEMLTERKLLVEDGKLQVTRAGKNSRIKTIGVLVSDLRRTVTRSSVESSRSLALQEKVKDLERQLKVAQAANAADDAMANLLNSIGAHVKKKGVANIGKKPSSFTRAKPTLGRALAGTPTLFLSDWHMGEVVDPDEVNQLNAFDLGIAFKRGERVFNTALELLFHHQSGQSYDGITVAFGGDMLSGNIHDELRRTNEKCIFECLRDTADFLVGNLIEVSKNFDWVYVPCVSGNHGRIDKKPVFKNSTKENFDTHLYHYVARIVEAKLGSRCNVQFDISDAADLRYDLYGTKYLLTHGDQVQTSTNSASFWPSLIELAAKKQVREAQGRDGKFDYMLCGHFHRYATVSNVIVNGSLKGYDEFAYRMNYEAESARQALWITHPDYGIIEHRPVYAEEMTVDATSSAQPVTTYGKPRSQR